MTVPDLRRALKGLQDKEVLIPILHTSLNNPDFSSFTIQIEGWTPRPPDGYFHPSTQATWNTRQLALYLIAPHLFVDERMPLTGTLAITQGHFWHAFIQHVLEEQGILLESEVGFTDEEHRRRGHMDGRMDGEGLEIKTMNARTLSKIKTAEDLKALKFGYWSQAQEYLDYFDLPIMRFLILNADYPFTMKEFPVKADKDHQAQRRKTYKDAIRMANETKVLPLMDGACCGNPGACPATYACNYKE